MNLQQEKIRNHFKVEHFLDLDESECQDIIDVLEGLEVDDTETLKIIKNPDESYMLIKGEDMHTFKNKILMELAIAKALANAVRLHGNEFIFTLEMKKVRRS